MQIEKCLNSRKVKKVIQMNKTIKIIITIWTLVVIVLAAVVYVANNKEVNVGSNVNVEENKEGKVEQKGPDRIVMVNGKLYYYTGKESTVGLRCGTMDGKITSNIENTKINGKWIGIFKKLDNGNVLLDFTEKIETNNFVMKVLAKPYLKSQQKRYMKDLEKELNR